MKCISASTRPLGSTNGMEAHGESHDGGLEVAGCLGGHGDSPTCTGPTFSAAAATARQSDSQSVSWLCFEFSGKSSSSDAFPQSSSSADFDKSKSYLAFICSVLKYWSLFRQLHFYRIKHRGRIAVSMCLRFVVGGSHVALAVIRRQAGRQACMAVQWRGQLLNCADGVRCSMPTADSC